MLVITGYYETLDLFQEISYCQNLLSILDPETPSLKSKISPFVDHFRELYFHDISQPEEGLILPNRYHIEQIIQWSKECESQNAIILSGAGMGRSPSAALIALCEWGYSVDKAVQTLLNLKPLACPNRFMLKLYGNSDLEKAVVEAGFYDETSWDERSPLYIFLNLDGVLWRKNSSKLDDPHSIFSFTPECLDLLEEVLKPYDNYRLVCLGKHSPYLILEKIQSYFSPEIADNIVSVLSFEEGKNVELRYQNIVNYIEDYQLNRTCWVILDTQGVSYPSDTSVILTESDIGFDRQTAEALTVYLEMVS